MELRLVLVEPEYEENIGYCARLCANFSAKLCLVNPKTEVLTPLSRSRSMHGLDVLKKAKTYSNIKEATKGTISVAFTSRLRKTNYSNLLPKLSGDISLVLGRESKGLTKKEIEECSLEAHLPVTSSYKSLSLAHAAAISLFLTRQKQTKKKTPKSCPKLIDVFEKKVDKKKNIQNKSFCKKSFRKLITTSCLSEKELYSILSSIK